MDINVLVISVGNSRLAIGAFIAGQLQNVKRVSVENRSEWESTIAEVWQPLAGSAAAVVAASVNPPLFETVEHAVMQATNQSVVWVGQQIDLPIDVQTDSPKETGVDRVLNIAAAYEQMQKACVVVDAGTAITVDCCNDNGDFIGGAIAPGMQLQLDSMHAHTAKLPKVKLESTPPAIPKTTADAMRAGVFFGIRGLVKELVEMYATELGSWPEVIVTGGDAVAIFKDWELIHAIAPDLTLYGIALAYTEHHINHDM